ncbi:hypothetical protein SRHO_G00266320 [Serrasalmus rhombeus]
MHVYTLIPGKSRIRSVAPVQGRPTECANLLGMWHLARCANQTGRLEQLRHPSLPSSRRARRGGLGSQRPGINHSRSYRRCHSLAPCFITEIPERVRWDK